MKKRKLRLDTLQIKSFKTSETKEVKGGVTGLCQDSYTGKCCKTANNCEINDL